MHKSHEMEKPINIIQAFDCYLPTTTNWIYNLLERVPDFQMVIAAERFIPCNFYSDNFQYLQSPIRTFDHLPQGIGTRLWNKLARSALDHYPRMVAAHASDASLIHSHFSFVGWKFRKVAKRLDIPHAISFYGVDYEYYPTRFPEWKKRYSILFQEADAFFCEGGHGAGILESMGCPPEKIQIVRLGVNTEKIPFFTRIKEPGCLHLVQVATFREKKGHMDTINAFMEALKFCPKMTLTLVGREGSREVPKITVQIKKLVHGTPAEARIQWIERIDFSSLHEFLRDFHVFIHPSCHTKLKDCEGGAPIVLLDAQATGMPVISTLHCDIPGEVVHGVTGLLSIEKDIKEISESIQRFYEMGQEEYDRFAHAARKHVESDYDTKKCALRLGHAYKSLIDGQT